MKRQCTFVLALAAAIVSGVGLQRASGQRLAAPGYPKNGPIYRSAANFAPPAQVEELPAGEQAPEGPFRDDPVVNELHGGAHNPGGYYDEGYSQEGSYGCNEGCATGCGSAPRDSSSWFGSGGQWFFTADYIYARASFSEATAFVDVDDQGAFTDSDYVALDFDYESSYRFGGGYRLCCCGDEIRFMYTRLNSSASDEAAPGDVVPFEAAPPPGGFTEIDADVDLNSLDIEFAKRIPLGGDCCCGCGDACGGACGSECGGAGGCGDASCQCCPAWDLTWSGGVRIAEADWERSYIAFNAQDFAVTEGRSEMDFEGAGLRTGLEGRRYFFKDGWLSLYMKGDISLLMGDVEVDSSRAVNDPNQVNNPIAEDTQSFDTRQIIPVTEIEAGLTTRVTCHSSFTAGYMFAAWHDLGFRDEPEIIVPFQPPIRYDDGNILGFDGFFARFEYAF